jgi:DNA polymerase-4
LPYFVSDKSIILETAKDLLYQEKMSNSVRLLGISLSNLNTEDSKKKKVEVRENPVIVQLRFEF